MANKTAEEVFSDQFFEATNGRNDKRRKAIKSDRIQWAIEKYNKWRYGTYEDTFPDWLKTHSEDL